MNTKNSKTSESNRSRLYFTDKLDFRGNKTIALANCQFVIHGKM